MCPWCKYGFGVAHETIIGESKWLIWVNGDVQGSVY